MAKPSEKNGNRQGFQSSDGFKTVTLTGATGLQPSSIPKKYNLYRKIANVSSKPNGYNGGMPSQTTKPEYDAVEQTPTLIPSDILATWGIFKDDVRELRIDCGSEVCEANAFKGIYNLQGILTMKNLKDIGFSAFEDAGSSGGFRCDFFATPIEKIGQSAFAGCGIIGDIILPYTLTELGDRAFVNNFRSTKISVPATVTTFGASVFENNTKVTEVLLDDGLAKVGDAAFRNCEALPIILVPTSVEEIGNSAFENCKLLILAGIGGNANLTIGSRAFKSCKTLSSVSFGAGVKGISPEAFYGCSITGNINLTNTCETISYRSFYRGIKSANVSFPSSQPFGIGPEAFRYCELSNLVYRLEEAASIGNRAFANVDTTNEPTWYLGSNRDLNIASEAFSGLDDGQSFHLDFPSTKFTGSGHFQPSVGTGVTGKYKRERFFGDRSVKVTIAGVGVVADGYAGEYVFLPESYDIPPENGGGKAYSTKKYYSEATYPVSEDPDDNMPIGTLTYDSSLRAWKLLWDGAVGNLSSYYICYSLLDTHPQDAYTETLTLKDDAGEWSAVEKYNQGDSVIYLGEWYTIVDDFLPIGTPPVDGGGTLEPSVVDWVITSGLDQIGGTATFDIPAVTHGLKNYHLTVSPEFQAQYEDHHEAGVLWRNRTYFCGEVNY